MRRHLWAAMGAAVLLFLGGCSTIQKVMDAADKLEQFADKTELQRDKVDKALAAIEGVAGQIGDKGTLVLDIVGKVREAFATADKNQDNKVSGINEWQALLFALGSAIVGAVGGGAQGKRALDKLTAAKTDLYSKLDELWDEQKKGGA